MTSPCLPGIFDRGAVSMAPAAVVSRRSGRSRAVSGVPASMLAYRDALIAHGPATDHEIADVLGWALSSVNGRRGDWNVHAPGQVEAAGRQRKVWPDGSVTTRTLWRWCEPSQPTLAGARS